MFVGSSTLVVAEKEDGILPGRTGHESIHNLCHLLLTAQDRCVRPGMLVIEAVTGFNEDKAWKRAFGQIGVIRRQGGNVGCIDTEGIRLIANYAGWLSRGRTGARCISMQILVGIREVGEVG